MVSAHRVFGVVLLALLTTLSGGCASSSATARDGTAEAAVAGGRPGGRVLSVAEAERLASEGRFSPPEEVMPSSQKYLARAFLTGARGVFIGRCVVRTSGVVDSCQVEQSLPPMDADILQALSAARYEPARVDGEAVDVEKVFRVLMGDGPGDEASPSAPVSPTEGTSVQAPEALEDARPFDRGVMTEPRPVRPQDCGPSYTKEALANRVEGTGLYRCTLRKEGRVDSCKVLKAVPSMDESVLESLRRCRFTPATYRGEPLDVVYTFRFTFKAP